VPADPIEGFRMTNELLERTNWFLGQLRSLGHESDLGSVESEYVEIGFFGALLRIAVDDYVLHHNEGAIEVRQLRCAVLTLLQRSGSES